MTTGWKDLPLAPVSPDRSLILRYLPALQALGIGAGIQPHEVARSSIAEGARFSLLTRYRGVEIYLCDESSAMATGTYKDLDACLVVATARQAGTPTLVLSSGGNLGYSIAVYGRRADVGIFLFHPSATSYKLDGMPFRWEGIRRVAVDLPEPRVKSLARAFARAHGLVHVPDREIRLAASAARALFLVEAAENIGKPLDHVVQAVCAGYGPVGMYRCYAELVGRALLERERVPRFLGVQQGANAPVARAWRDGSREIRPEHVLGESEECVEPGLYNTNPSDNYAELYSLARDFDGDLEIVRRESYLRHVETVHGWFDEAGYEFTRSPSGGGDVLEKAGLLAGVGIVTAIDAGRIRPGERVAYMLTGGFRQIEAGVGVAPPGFAVDAGHTEHEWVRRIGDHFGLAPAPEGRTLPAVCLLSP